MPNISEINQELVRAFNINLRFNGIAITNLTVQNLYGKDHIVISFDKDMNSKQCMGYLSDLKDKIIKRSYKNEKAAGISYNLQSFPFAFHKSQLGRDSEGRSRFSVVIDEGVAYNLKCYLAQALAGNITVGMAEKFGVKYIKEHIYDMSFDKNSYLLCMRFYDKRLQEYFVGSFLKDIEGYENAPSDHLEVDGNLVYIKKGIFDNIEFIKDIAAYNASLECRYLQTSSTKSKAVDKLKYTMIDFMDRVADIPVRTITRTSYRGSDENSILIPLAQNGQFLDFLTEDNANDLNHAFGDEVVTEIETHRLKNPYWNGNEVYAIDFSSEDRGVDIACCVMNKIIENSVINKNHELTIDPELLPPKKKPCLPSSSFVDEDEGVCASLPKSMDFPPDEACTAYSKDSGFSQQSHGQPSSMVFGNHLTQLTDQQARFKDAQLPVRVPRSEAQIDTAVLDVDEVSSEPYSPPISPISGTEPRSGSRGCWSPLLNKMNSTLSLSSRFSSPRSSRSSSNLSNIRVTQPPKQDKVFEVS